MIGSEPGERGNVGEVSRVLVAVGGQIREITVFDFGGYRAGDDGFGQVEECRGARSVGSE